MLLQGRIPKILIVTVIVDCYGAEPKISSCVVKPLFFDMLFFIEPCSVPRGLFIFKS